MFAPDGSEVLFGSDRSGKWQIWSAKGEKPLTSGGGYAGRFSTDGSAFYVTKFDSPGLFRLDLASGREEKVAGTEALLGASSWTIDAGGVWFLGADSGELKLYRLELPSGALSDRGAIDADFGGGLAFDPVRERMLFTRVVRSESDLVLARLP